MLEYDMMSGEFLDEHSSAPGEVEDRDPRRRPWLELRLLSVEEAEAERNGRRRGASLRHSFPGWVDGERNV